MPSVGNKPTIIDVTYYGAFNRKSEEKKLFTIIIAAISCILAFFKNNNLLIELFWDWLKFQSKL